MKTRDEQPLVSVIVATYRRSDRLEVALQSLVQQSYSPIEVLVVDDNGNEKWNTIVRNIVAGIENINIRYIANAENLGAAKTRNVGIEAANGEYITFLDDDDIYLKHKVKTQLYNMLEHSSDYSITNLDLYNENDKLIDRRLRNYIKSYERSDLLEYHFLYHMTGNDTMMFTKEYLSKIDGFSHIDVGDDFYLMQKAINGNGVFSYLNESHVKAYVHSNEGGLSSGIGKINGENALYEYKKTFFEDMRPKTRRYIAMRHYAVLAFAYLRNKQYFWCFFEVIKSFVSSPIGLMHLLLKGR